MVDDPSKMLEEAMADSAANLQLKAEVASKDRQAARARELLSEARTELTRLSKENARLEQELFNAKTLLHATRSSWLFPFFSGWFKRAVISAITKCY